MSDFETCMAFTRVWDGGFLSNPKAPGGAVEYGISLRYLREQAPELETVDEDGDISADTILSLTPSQAERLYRSKFWDALDLDTMLEIWRLPMFDTAVCMGAARAVKICQETIRDLGPPVVVDGVFGPLVRNAADVVAAYRGREVCDRYCLVRLKHYADLVAGNGNLAQFLRGWINRTVALADACKRDTIL